MQRLPLGRAAPRNVGLLAQQAAEKALKAVFVFLQIQYPFTHDLNELRDIVPADWQSTTGLADLSPVTEFAVRSRYPGGRPEPTEVEAGIAVDLAREVLGAVLRDLLSRGFSDEA